jgi:hypothetical protein
MSPVTTALAPKADPRQEHLHLLGRRVLRSSRMMNAWLSVRPAHVRERR